ncbi:hypothetical protein ABZV15_41360 [Streptomyces sp. NPDC005246]|uniref:hypothetical protein n=1 Tax=Streptomyces sp. NPDC005246 TaxID=3156716 RepID=UPI0033B8D48E
MTVASAHGPGRVLQAAGTRAGQVHHVWVAARRAQSKANIRTESTAPALLNRGRLPALRPALRNCVDWNNTSTVSQPWP